MLPDLALIVERWDQLPRRIAKSAGFDLIYGLPPKSDTL
jgi:hypothetical protein